MDDPAVDSLKRLIGHTAARRQEVADRLGFSEQYLYQIANGILLKSGKPRVVGRKLREALDRVYPGWSEGMSSLPAAHPRPTLPTALPVVLDELQGLSPSRWAAARAVLDQLVTRPDLRAEAEAELLHLLSAPAAKRPAAP